jgi:hypothetical protein
MTHPSVLLIGENPQLGASLAELLEAEAVPSSTVKDLREALEKLGPIPPASAPLLLLASNRVRSPTLHAWLEGGLERWQLVVVGCRDARVRSGAQLHVVSLPLDVTAFLRLIRELVHRSPDGGSAAAS